MKNIIIVDFGSQTAHLIGRRLRDLSVDVKIVEPSHAYSICKKEKPAGIILSGGPSSVYEKGAPTVDKRIFGLGIPLLGICYGWQLTANLIGGKTEKGNKEYGPTILTITNSGNPLFKRIKNKELRVWMSHGDEVKKLPPGFEHLANTPGVIAAAVVDKKRKIYGIQFHPEVIHTPEGRIILENFARFICFLPTSAKSFDLKKIIERVRLTIDKTGKDVRVIAAVSGGVDSTVASALVAKAIGKRFLPVFCDNGLMREGTAKEVENIFNNHLKVRPIILDCKKAFLNSLKGVTDPEKKRKIIGELYIKLFESVAKKQKYIKFLVQGTIYSDVIESKGTKHASHIKSHHNVGGLPAKMGLELLEPLCEFYKDEVRLIGKELGLPDSFLMKQPFPGPGQAIRILGEVTAKRLAKQQKIDQIVLQVIKETGWYENVFQSFPVLTGAMSTAVKGDGRAYGEVVGLRIYDGQDIMTAGWTHLPYDILQKLSSRIVNEVPGVSRVVYDITTKPPATMEWE